MTDKQKSSENEPTVPPVPKALPSPIADESRLVSEKTDQLLEPELPELIDEEQGETEEDIEVEVIDATATIDELNGVCTRRPDAVDNAIAELGPVISNGLIYEEDLTIEEFCESYRVPVEVIENVFHVFVKNAPKHLRLKKEGTAEA